MADIQHMSEARDIAEREVARTLRREKINASIRYVILLFVGLLMLYPLVWMFSASFKPNHEIFTTLSLWPAHATWDGFINGWKTGTEYKEGDFVTSGDLLYICIENHTASAAFETDAAKWEVVE